MADRPYERMIISTRERALSSDINQAESQLDRSLRFSLQNLLAASAGFVSGFLGNGYRVVPNSPIGMSVLVSAGLGLSSNPADVPAAIGGVIGLDDLCDVKPLVLNAPALFTVPANGSGNPRIDIIEVKIDRRAENPQSRLIFNPATEAFDPATVNKTLSFCHDGRTGTVATPAASTAGLSYKTGTPAGVPVAPPVTAGYTKIAEINVAAGAVTIATSQIVDRRVFLSPGGVSSVAASLRVQWNAGVPILTFLRKINPPGFDIAALAFPVTRGHATIVLVGGEIARYTVNYNPYPTFPGPGLAANQLVSSLGFGAVQTVDAGLQTAYAALGLNVAIGQKAIEHQLHCRFQSAGTTNVTDTTLEDLTWDFCFQLGY